MAENKKEPTPAEAMLFFSIVKNTRNKADVDWEAVAAEAGFKNAEVAKVRFGQVKRKLGIASEGGATTSPRTTPKKNDGVKKVTKPRSTGKGRGGRAKVKKEAKEEEDDGPGSVTPEAKHRSVKAEDDEGPDDQLQEEMNNNYHYQHEPDTTDPF